MSRARQTLKVLRPCVRPEIYYLFEDAGEVVAEVGTQWEGQVKSTGLGTICTWKFPNGGLFMPMRA